MKMYVITKTVQRAWGVALPRVHEVCDDLATAKARAKDLNERAQRAVYEVESAPFFESEPK